MMSIKLELASRGTADVYRFRPAADAAGVRDFGWAIATVNDTTGELLITSDWGNWAHRWPSDPKSLGEPSLTAFLGRFATYSDARRFDYLARKLLGDRAREFAMDATLDRLRGMICERRLDDARSYSDYAFEMRVAPLGRRRALMSKALARQLYDELAAIESDFGGANGREGAALLHERLSQEMHDQFSSLYESFQKVHTSDYQRLCAFLLPAICEACRARWAEQQRLIEAFAPAVAP